MIVCLGALTVHVLVLFTVTLCPFVLDSSSARKALNDFWRTHQETWHTFKSQFTEDEQYMLTDLLISPTYYA
eukprot:m.148042 g.148042  ORF g.148042 m.148042 type:complete len:72 (-) comp14167_c0_seq13:5808-6023(-)